MVKEGHAPSVTTAGSLIDGCFAGHDPACRELHRTYYPVARTFFHRLGLLATKMDDACREVFVQLLRYLSGFEQREELKTSVYRLCLAQSRLRRRRVQRAPAALDKSSTPAGDAGQQSSQEDMQRRVVEALGAMKVRSRVVFVLYELEELPAEHIGRILGCPEATVRRRLRDARKEFEAFDHRSEAERAASRPATDANTPRRLIHRGDPLAEGLRAFARASAIVEGEREVEAWSGLRRRLDRPPRGVIVALLGAGAVAAACILLLQRRSTGGLDTAASAPTVPPPVMAQPAAEVPAPTSVPAPPAPPSHAAIRASEIAVALPRATVDVVDHARVTLSSDGAATIRAQGDAAVISLAAGSVKVETAGSAPGRTWIHARRFTFIDAGTSYTVTARPRATELRVTDGSVEVWRQRRVLGVIFGPAGFWTSAEIPAPVAAPHRKSDAVVESPSPANTESPATPPPPAAAPSAKE
jgi:RNA polymerase sigma factor (sigma-70 family)